jgi:hypothetical protein
MRGCPVVVEYDRLVTWGWVHPIRTLGQLCLLLGGTRETYASPMTCRIEVFVRSGHTIDLALEDGEDRSFVLALHEAWKSPEAIGFTHLALGENAVILASEVVGYRLHGTLRRSSTL